MHETTLKHHGKHSAICLLTTLLATVLVLAVSSEPLAPTQRAADLVTVRGTVVTADGKPLGGVNGSSMDML